MRAVFNAPHSTALNDHNNHQVLKGSFFIQRMQLLLLALKGSAHSKYKHVSFGGFSSFGEQNDFVVPVRAEKVPLLIMLHYPIFTKLIIGLCFWR